MKIIRPTAVLDSGGGAFSRASTATYYDSAKVMKTAAVDIPRIGYDPATGTLVGPVIESAATNLLTYSEYWDNSAWVKTACTVGPSTQPALDGTLTVDVITWTGLGNIDRPLTLSGTGTYTFSCFIHTSSTCTSLSVVIYWLGSSTQAAFVAFNPTTGVFISQGSTAGATIIGYTITNVGNGWYRVSVSGTGTNSNNTIVQSQLYNNIASSCKAVVWGGQLETGSTLTSYIPSVETWTGRASTATYINSSGLIATQSSGVARSSYNPLNLTLAPRLLLENAATNLLTYSEQFDNAAWAKFNTTVAVNAIAAPDGTLTADKVVESVTSATHIVYAGRAGANETVTFSVYLKAAGRSKVYLQFSDFVLWAWGAMFDLTLGAVIFSDAPTAQHSSVNSYIENIGNGWYRCSITAAKGAANPNNNVSITTVNAANAIVYTGDGTSGLYVWGAQLEATSYPTSYIQTVGASASRLADTSSSVTSTRAADVEGAGSFSRSTTATYFDAAGVMQTAAINVPRIGYDPVTHAHTGLIIEGAATNAVINGTTYCAGTSTAASTGTATGPDGVLATKVIPTAGAVSYPGSGYPATQTFANAQSFGQYTDYTFSGYFAPYGPLNYQPYIVITANTNPGNDVYALVFFDSTSGVFYGKTLSGGFADLTAPEATLMPCGMWLVKWTVRFTQQALLRTLVYHYLQVANASRTTVYTADGLSGIQRACHQFEVGAVATSYIPTTSAQVTRAADIITGTGFIYSNLPEGGGTLLTKPETLATQSLTVSATPYTISFTGTGSIALSGTYSGSLVGTGTSNRVSLTFTPTAGTLTITVTGSVKLAQLELGSTLSPYRNETEWNAATSYTVGQQVIRTTSATHKIYENLSAGVDSTFPELLPARWLEVAPTNRWGVFDSQVGTVSTALNSITYLLKPGRINSIALLEADAALVTLSLVLPSGQVIHASSADLNAGTTVGDWYQYFYEPIYQQDSLVVTNLLDTALLNLPTYAGATLAITLSKPSGTVSCGIIVVGLSADLGSTQRAPSIGIIDYSTKVVDTFGNFTITKRKYSKRMNVKLAVPSNTVDATSRVISQYRSTPLVWVGAENLYTSLIIYGFYRDFDITIDNQIMSTCDIQIEGLT